MFSGVRTPRHAYGAPPPFLIIADAILKKGGLLNGSAKPSFFSRLVRDGSKRKGDRRRRRWWKVY